MSRVGPSPQQICAAPTPAAPTLTVSQGRTRGRGRTGQCVSVTRALEVSVTRHECDVTSVMSGNGVTGCTRGDCISLRHEMCPNNKACYDSTCVGKKMRKKYISLTSYQPCQDPCGPTFCGGNPCCAQSAQCRGVDHKAECSCPPGAII